MVSFAKIPDLLGYLVLTEYGAVLESDGELKNDENCANIVTSLINLADRYAQTSAVSMLFVDWNSIVFTFRFLISVWTTAHCQRMIAKEYPWYLRIIATQFAYRIKRFTW